ncbi:MAG: RDD family protein, partial [Candidatus Eremiobacteraeota bacterium]|nr:RDD family protein [Candidatus Eremiobacteraeota bacterium]
PFVPMKNYENAMNPFLLGAGPAAFKNTDTGIYLSVLENRSWKKKKFIPGTTGDEEIKGIFHDNILHLFKKSDNRLFYHRGIPENETSWKEVAMVHGPWSSLVYSNQPAIFYKDENGFVHGIIKEDDSWKEFFKSEYPWWLKKISAHQGIRPNRIKLYGEFLPANLHIRNIKFGRVSSEGCLYTVDGLFFFVKVTIVFLFVPLILGTIIFAFILGLGTKGKENIFHLEDFKRNYAGVLRRTFARLTDWGLQGFVALILGKKFIMHVLTTDHISGEVIGKGIELLFPPLIWLIATTVLFVAGEAYLGISPGKFIFGIRVWGKSAKACGIREALIRTIYLAYDGLFCGIPGYLEIFRSPLWQRKGDKAVDTVVVLAKKTLWERRKKW